MAVLYSPRTCRFGYVYYTRWQNVIGLNRTLQMCTVKTESGLGYKSSPSPSPSPSPAKMDLSPDSSRPTTSLEVVAKVAKQENRQHYSQVY